MKQRKSVDRQEARRIILSLLMQFFKHYSIIMYHYHPVISSSTVQTESNIIPIPPCMHSEFVYPASWLADQRLYQRYAERLEKERPLDPPSLRSARRRRSNDVPEPTAAYGPPGSNGEDNISVIVAPIREGFRLENMGTPAEAAERFLATTVAPQGSDKVAALLDARARRDGKDGELYYSIEFTVESTSKGWKRHNIAVYGSRNGLLYTLNAQSAESRWTREREEQFQRAASTFRIVSTGAGTAGFPDRL